MPTTNDTRAIKINANNPNKMVLFAVSAIVLGAVVTFLGCKIGFIQGGICGTKDLKANTPPLTPVPTETALPVANAPVIEKLPGCYPPVEDNVMPPACGAIMYSGSGQPVLSCNENGTANLSMKFLVSGEAANDIAEKISKGIPVESDPVGACSWSGVSPVDQEGYYEALLVCSAPSGVTLKITEALGGNSCEITEPCPQGFFMETSQLAATGKYYCVPENQPAVSESCTPGTFLDEANQCCNPQPLNSEGFVCPNMQQTANGFSCDVDYSISLEALRNGFEMPECNTRPQDNGTGNEEEQPRTEPEPTTCVPDATGGGCP